MIQIDGLCKQYENGFTALKGIDLTIHKGEFFGLLGLNGAGKSTFINILCHILHKTSGTITIDGLDFDQHLIPLKRKMGFMAQELNFNPFSTVDETLRYQAGFYGLSGPSVTAHIDELLGRLHLSDKKHAELRMLSGGMKRRVMLARAIVSQPEYLFLDEPTAGVDVDLRKDIYKLLKEMHKKGTTMILTSHYMEDIETLCDHVAIIHRGTVVNQGPIDSINLGDKSPPSYHVQIDSSLPEDFHIDGLSIRVMGPRQLDITVTKPQLIHDWIAAIHQRGLHITHIHSSKNRLESYMSQYTRELS